MSEIVKTVGEMVEALQKLPPEWRVISLEPPFTGVKIVNQESGSILFAAPPREDYSKIKATRAVA